VVLQIISIGRVSYHHYFVQSINLFFSDEIKLGGPSQMFGGVLFADAMAFCTKGELCVYVQVDKTF
jgi:hypothetical protein